MNLTDIQARLQAFADPRFSFTADTHEYFLSGKPLLSFSTWIKDFTEPFDELKVAGFSASKRGCTVEEVLAEWKASRTLGTQVHALIERFYTRPNEPLTDWQDQHPDVVARYAKFVKFHTERLHTLAPLALELQVFNEPAGLCGTIDYVGQHKDTGGLYVLDFKSNKEITRTAGRFTKRMRGALCDLYDLHSVKYSLQISYYRVLLEESGIPTAGGALVWLPPGDTPAEIIQATDYRKRIRSLLFPSPHA